MNIENNKGITLEEVKAAYFDKDAIITTPTKVYKFEHPAAKFYFTYDMDEFKPNFFISVSSVLDSQVPMAKEIIEMMVKMGKNAFDEHVRERKMYGMIMDRTFKNLLIKKEVDLMEVPQIVSDFMVEHSLSYNQEWWTEELRKDILSFGNWVYDYNVKPLSIGQLLVSENLGIGGEIDLVCMMNDKGYTDKTPELMRKRVIRIVDFKSGKKGFYDTNILQLGYYKEVWNENFPEYPCDSIANWGGKNWRSEANYEFKVHDSNPVLAKCEYYLELAKIDNITPDRTVRIYNGSVVIGQPVSDRFQALSTEQIINEIMTKRI